MGLNIAERLKKEARESVLDISGQDLSLAGGLSGLLLLFSTLQNYPGSGLAWEDEVHHCVIGIKNILEKDGFSDLSMFGGIAGVCFALEIAAEKHNRYRRMLQTLQILILKNVHKNYIDQMIENKSSGKPSTAQLYDLIQGVCGIGRYALKNRALTEFNDLAIDIVKVLVLFCQPIIVEGAQVPGWYLPATDPLNRRNPDRNGKGNFNLGLAHGITGVLAFLSISALSGIVVEGQTEVLRLISSWICSKGKMQWPSSISWDEEVNSQGPLTSPSRDAWCYGAPGIARSLFLAGKALSDETLQSFALSAFKGVFTRAYASQQNLPVKALWQLPGCGICHGIAGLLLITNAMSREEKGQDLIVERKKLENLLLSEYDENLAYKFPNVEPNSEGNPVQVNRIGLLEGAAGVALSLLNIDNHNLNWLLPFLIHV